jgi:hypothetical protein
MPPLRMYQLCCMLMYVACPTCYVRSAALGRTRHERPTQRSVLFRNNSGRRVDVLWVNNFKQPTEFVSQNNNEGYPYGGDTNFLSYIGHEFEVRELPSKKTGSCKFDECRKVKLVGKCLLFLCCVVVMNKYYF